MPSPLPRCWWWCSFIAKCDSISPLFQNSLICTGKIHNSWMTDQTKNVDGSPMHTKANQRSVNWCQTQQQTMPGTPPPVRDADGVCLLLNETLSLSAVSKFLDMDRKDPWELDDVSNKNVDGSPMHTKANQRSVDQCPTINRCPTHIIMKSSQNDDDSLDSFFLAW